MAKIKSPEFDHPDDLDSLEDCECTLMTATEDCDLTEKQWNQLVSGTMRQLDSETGRGEPLSPIETTEPTPDGDHIRWMQINVEDLYKILYEHQRYSSAKGFSTSEIDVLRAIEETDLDRVMFDDFADDFRVEDYAKSTIYNALRALKEKELLEQVGRGVYRYTGPS